MQKNLSNKNPGCFRMYNQTILFFFFLHFFFLSKDRRQHTIHESLINRIRQEENTGWGKQKVMLVENGEKEKMETPEWSQEGAQPPVGFVP